MDQPMTDQGGGIERVYVPRVGADNGIGEFEESRVMDDLAGLEPVDNDETGAGQPKQSFGGSVLGLGAVDPAEDEHDDYDSQQLNTSRRRLEVFFSPAPQGSGVASLPADFWIGHRGVPSGNFSRCGRGIRTPFGLFGSHHVRCISIWFPRPA